MIDLTAQVVADVAGLLLGKVLGRTFELERDRAQRIGYYLVWGIIAVAAITVTFIYS